MTQIFRFSFLGFALGLAACFQNQGGAPPVHSPHSELISEMYRVVLLKEPEASTFWELVNAMSQGASIEGIYNGLTHSAQYRQLEMTDQAISSSSLKIFAELLEDLEAELPIRTEFDGSAAQPLELLLPDQLSSIEKGSRRFSQPQDFKKIFASASFFTLKRVLGDEAIKVIAIKSSDSHFLASWYSHWVSKMAARQVDFGLQLRNDSNQQFHDRWALGASEDRLKWEVLNRIHRVLNSTRTRPNR